jgi:hypothetical protein
VHKVLQEQKDLPNEQKTVMYDLLDTWAKSKQSIDSSLLHGALTNLKEEYESFVKANPTRSTTKDETRLQGLLDAKKTSLKEISAIVDLFYKLGMRPFQIPADVKKVLGYALSFEKNENKVLAPIGKAALKALTDPSPETLEAFDNQVKSSLPYIRSHGAKAKLEKYLKLSREA